MRRWRRLRLRLRGEGASPERLAVDRESKLPLPDLSPLQGWLSILARSLLRAFRGPSARPHPPLPLPPGFPLFFFFWKLQALGAQDLPPWDEYLIVRSTF